MAKAKKRLGREVQSSHEVRYPVSVPEVVNMDALSVISDDDLSNRAQAITSDRAKVIDSGNDPLLWEIELCYTQREFQMRRSRREMHEKFMKDQSKISFDDESELPSAEFDNLRYAAVN